MKKRVNQILECKRCQKTLLLQFGQLMGSVGPYSFLVSNPQPNMIMIYLLSLRLVCTSPNVASPALEIVKAGLCQSGSKFFLMKNCTEAAASRTSHASVWSTNAPRISETCDVNKATRTKPIIIVFLISLTPFQGLPTI